MVTWRSSHYSGPGYVESGHHVQPVVLFTYSSLQCGQCGMAAEVLQVVATGEAIRAASVQTGQMLVV